ncbi:MAG TPA: DUF4139 domain-containing protein [Allosphingosinicella sp.]|nr:DUF4139 domain-containing protein [Allosphingosinicella sp.]
MRPILCLFILAAAPALAQPVIPPPSQSAQGDVAVTIYNNDIALVQDRRDVDIPAGRSRQEFPDVSAQIRAETVTLTGAGVGIVEQNFDYDLLSPQALMQEAVGETITLVRTNPATGQEQRERARVLAVNGGVVLQVGDRIEVLRDDGLPVRVIFDRVPENLRARPTLSVTVQSEQGGRRPVTLTYLTPGLGWQADYVALFDEAAGRMDVQGWITLTNNSGTPYVNADVLLVAGAVGGQGGQRVVRRPPPPPGSLRDPGTETAARERLGDFYLYPLPERTTVAHRQIKQVSFLDVRAAPAARAYEFRNAWLGTMDEARSASSVLRFSSSREQGLGDALPAGTVRVYQRDARGNPQFVGEAGIGHIPMGSELGLVTGLAFDVKVQPIVERRERVTAQRWRTSMRYRLTNAGPAPVTVILTQDGLWGDTRIAQESQPSERISADSATWRVTVPANGEAIVTATFDSRY